MTRTQPDDIHIEAVYLAQTHVMKPDQPYCRLAGNRDALLKVHLISESGAAAPSVQALARSKAVFTPKGARSACTCFR